MALRAIQIKHLNRNGLSLQTRPKLFLDEPLVHGPEPAFPEIVAPREAVGHLFQLRERETVNVRQGNGQVAEGELRAPVAEAGQRQP